MTRNLFASLPIAAAIGCLSTAQAQSLQCTDIARTLKEFSISTSSSSYLNSVFDSYCEASGSAKQSGVGIGLDAIVKAIPIKFTGSYSSSEDAVKNFCKNYSSSTSLQERKYSYEEKIASKALDTVTDCLKLQSQGITITHDILNKEVATFYLKSAVEQKIVVSGVATSGPISCTGHIGGQSKSINETTGIAVQKTQNFSCKRRGSSTSANQPKVYEEATVTIATNFGNYNVLWPRDERLPEDMASMVGKDLEELKGNLKKRKLQCAVAEAQSPVKRGPDVEASIPEALRNDYLVTGGGCEIPAFYGHNPPIFVSRPTATGWHCKAGDPPNIELSIAVKARVIYCRDSAS
jgi:hypothetical protein